MSKIKTPPVILSYRFLYDGISRIVDNVTLENNHQTILGMEIRKGGRWSWKIKRYKLARIADLKLIDPVERTGSVKRP